MQELVTHKTNAKRALLEAQMPVRRKQARRAAKLCAGFLAVSAVSAAMTFAVAVKYDERIEGMVAPKMQSALEKQAKKLVRQHIPLSDMHARVVNAKDGEGVFFNIEISSEDISAHRADVKQELVDRAGIQLNILLAASLSVFGGTAHMAQKYGRRSRQKFKRAQSMKRHLDNLDHE
jgi:hypothetical protein